MSEMKKIVFSILFMGSYLFAFEQIKPFSLWEVRLRNSPFLAAQQTDKNYILSLNPDKLLAPFLKEAGLPIKADNYGNWENTGLDGHIGGHYLSALSNMYAATGDTLLLVRLRYMLHVLQNCQRAGKTGYIGGTPGGKAMWEDVKLGKIKAELFSLNGKWVPLYNIHKLFAGLIDAYTIAHVQEAKNILIGLSKWFYTTMNGLTDQQLQEMLRSEHGGMNEALLDVFLITKDQKYVRLAERFSHRALLDPMLEQKDVLTKLHANMQIPKVVGFARIGAIEQKTNWTNAAQFFWETVTKHRTISIGGNSVSEHFHPIDDFSSMLYHREGPETCNSYNMLKLTKALYLSNPSAAYISYYERTLYNHILSSQHPGGGFVYFTAARPGHYKVYSQPQESFWCCVGSGMENHGKYGELIYAHSNNELYVNLFIPSQLSWKEKGIQLIQHTSFPEKEKTTISIAVQKPVFLTLRIRYPEWVVPNGFELNVNGRNIRIQQTMNGYADISRVWHSGDKIEVSLPMQTHLDYLPDGKPWASIRKGPIVMAATWEDTAGIKGFKADGSRMGHVAAGPLIPLETLPLLISEDVHSNELNASFLNGVQKKFTLKPFYSIHDSRYIFYWRVRKNEDSIQLSKEFKTLDKK